MSHESALAVSGISKTFAGQPALREVSMSVAKGSVHALVGQNGCGKSTLIKILAGVVDPDAGGGIAVTGVSLAPGSPTASDRLGLRFVHQDLGLVSSLDVVDNLALGVGYPRRRTGTINWRAARESARDSLTRLGYSIDVSRPVSELTISERTAVAVARALDPTRSAPTVLVLDEPTANLPRSESQKLFALIRAVRDEGVSVLLVTHHIDEVFDIADHVTVLRDGRWVSTDRIEDLTHDRLVARMIGRAVEGRGRLVEAGSKSDGAIVLDVQNLSTTVLRGISLAVRKGEVVGIAGLTGSGREQLGPALFGAIQRQGSVAVLGTKLAAHDPHAAVAAGMALVPAERHANALFLDATVATNVTAVGTERFTRFGLVAAGRESADVDDWIRRLGVNPPDGKRPIATLSGGNQQKVVLARWLRNGPTILILDDPTQGVDVGAKAEIHQLVASAAAQGAAVLVISTDHEELTSLCHRVEVLVRGHLSASLPGHELSDSVITAATLAAASSVSARVGEPA